MVILTGATGFLGSQLLLRLLESRRVLIIVRGTSKLDRLKDCLHNVNLKICNLETTRLEDIFKENHIKVIIHTATTYGRDSESISEVLNSNLVLPIRLIELGIQFHVPLFINTDSYFNKNDYCYSSLFNYSLSKKSLLIWLQHLATKIKIINIRLEHIYGPMDNKNKFVEHLIRDVAINKISEVKLTSGAQKRDFIYIDDVVDAYEKIINYGLSNIFTYEDFELGCGKSIELKEFAQKVKRISKSSTFLNFGAFPYKENEIMDSKANLDNLIRLGWKPSISIDDGLSRIIEIYNK